MTGHLFATSLRVRDDARCSENRERLVQEAVSQLLLHWIISHVLHALLSRGAEATMPNRRGAQLRRPL